MLVRALTLLHLKLLDFTILPIEARYKGLSQNQNLSCFLFTDAISCGTAGGDGSDVRTVRLMSLRPKQFISGDALKKDSSYLVLADNKVMSFTPMLFDRVTREGEALLVEFSKYNADPVIASAIIHRDLGIGWFQDGQLRHYSYETYTWEKMPVPLNNRRIRKILPNYRWTPAFSAL